MIGTVGEAWAPPAVLWLATYAIHSTLLLSGAYLIGRILRAYPHLVSTVWKSALVGGILTATIQVAFGVHPLAGRVQFGGPEPHARPLPEIAMPSTQHIEVPAPRLRRYAEIGQHLEVAPAPVHALDDGLPKDVGPCQGTVQSVSETSGRGSLPPQSAASASAVSHEPSAWVRWLGLAWVAVAGLGLFGLAGTVVALRRQLASAHESVDGPLRTLFDRLCVVAGISSRVGLRVSSAIPVPLAAGVLRPCIYVPRRVLHDLDVSAQQSLLAHELGHVVRRDPLWRLLGLAIERLFFFQPLNRLANRELATQSELLADEWAAMRTRAPLALAQCLTEVAAWLPGRRFGVVPTMAGRPSMLARRVTRLIDQPASFGRAVVPWWGMPVVGVLFGGLAWVIPGVSHGEAPELACERGVVVVASELVGAGARLVVVPVAEHPVRRSHRDAGTRPVVADAPVSKRALAKQRRVAKRNIAREFRRARKEGRLPSAAELAKYGVHEPLDPSNDDFAVALRIEGASVVVVGPDHFDMYDEADEAELERAVALQWGDEASHEEDEGARTRGKARERRTRARAKPDQAEARARGRQFEHSVDAALRSLEDRQELTAEQWEALEAMMRSASEVDWPSVYRRMLEVQRHRLEWQQRQLERRIERGPTRGGRAQAWPPQPVHAIEPAEAMLQPVEGWPPGVPSHSLTSTPGLSLIAPVEPTPAAESPTERCRRT